MDGVDAFPFRTEKELDEYQARARALLARHDVASDAYFNHDEIIGLMCIIWRGGDRERDFVEYLLEDHGMDYLNNGEVGQDFMKLLGP